VVAEIAAERPAKIPRNRAKRVRTVEVPIEALEKQTGYQAPSEEAVKGDEPDEG
jgi:hypothetical protein